MSIDSPREEGDMSTSSIVKIAAVIFVIWVVGGIGTWFLFEESGDSGTFGDTFGAINALFSGMAFAGVIVAILLQRQELRLQRHELELTRAELHGQREAMERQGSTLRQQAFENKFFQMLGLHHQIVDAMYVYVNASLQIAGRECFAHMYKMLDDVSRKHAVNARSAAYADPNQLDKARENIDAINESFYQTYQGSLGHYFRNLYQIIKLVDRSNIEDKKFYTNLVRAQLSDNELCLLFYNCLSRNGYEKFYPLIEAYDLLQNLPQKKLLLPQDQIHYPSLAK